MQHSRWQWRRSVESAWFYAAWFCLFAAFVLFVAQRKYGERQAGIERRFQARSFPLLPSSGEQPPTEMENAENYYSTPQDTVIPLWPLVAVMVVLTFLFGSLAACAGLAAAPRQ